MLKKIHAYKCNCPNYLRVKKIISTTLFLFLMQLPFNLMAQSSKSPSSPSAIKWQFNTTVNGIGFYHAIIECNGLKTVLLKLENKSSMQAEVSWKETFFTDGNETEIQSTNLKQVSIAKGLTIIGNCADNNKKLKIISSEIHPAYIPVIKGFNYNEISVALKN